MDGTTSTQHASSTLQAAYNRFVAVDKDRTGELREEQLAKALEVFRSLKMDQAAASRLLAIADLDGSKSLNFSEFYSVFACLQILERHFDVNDRSKLTRADVKRALNNVGLVPDEAQVDRMLTFGESHSDSGCLEVDLENFLRIYLQHKPSDAGREVVFLHTWFSSARQPIDLPMPSEITPSQDFVAGTFAGVALTLVGHPFDTVKVRLQTLPFGGIWDCIRSTFEKENVLAFYKGMGGPMLTIPLINAIVFGAYAQGKSIAQKIKHFRGIKSPEISLPEIGFAGAYAGALSSLVACPVELVKTRLQIQYSASNETFRGPLDAVRKIFHQNGLKGLFRGMSATIYREIPGYGAQFVAYEKLKRTFEKSNNTGPLPLIFAGGTAGIIGWIVSYPMDYIKSQIQAEPFDKKTPYHKNKWLLDGGFFSCWRQTVKQHGHRELWRGFGPCVARAFPANGAAFFAYELALKLIKEADAPPLDPVISIPASSIRSQFTSSNLKN